MSTPHSLSSTPPPSLSSDPATSWTLPPCFLNTTEDALRLLEAATQGIIPRLVRRPRKKDYEATVSGSIFVYDEDESGVKSWRDGRQWSHSTSLGNFLIYRETKDKRYRPAAARGPVLSTSSLAADPSAPGRYRAPKGRRSRTELQYERSLVGGLTKEDMFVEGGFVKKVFRLRTEGSALHIISYYTIEHLQEGGLVMPSSIPELNGLTIRPEYLLKHLFQCPPKVMIGTDGVAKYIGEGDTEVPTFFPAPTFFLTDDNTVEPVALPLYTRSVLDISVP